MSREFSAVDQDAPFGETRSAAVRTFASASDDPLQSLPVHDWSGTCTPAEREAALQALEAGKILFLPQLAFAIEASERRLLDPLASDGRAKNISFDPRTGRVGGTSLSGPDREAVASLLQRFGAQSQSLLSGLFPNYTPHLEIGRASLRPVSIDQRRMPYRRDDRRLHVDAFPSQPVQGRRILRVFANVNADGAARVWHVGEPFQDYARRFLRWPYALPGSAALLAWLGVTKGRRTIYDQLMLSLHDRAKADTRYQRDHVHAEISFPASTTWIVYTDLVSHAAIAGQHALEHTFYLPLAAMHEPDRAPLSVLERLTGRPLLV